MQKWNRSIPDGNETAAAVLFLLYILKQFYLVFPSWGWSGGCVSVRLFFMLLCDCMKKTGQLLQLKTEESLFYVSGICFDD